jgi:hypothetical protein
MTRQGRFILTPKFGNGFLKAPTYNRDRRFFSQIKDLLLKKRLKLLSFLGFGDRQILE